MKFMVLLLALLGYVVLAKSSLDDLPVHPGVGGLYRGPNSETIIKGPDGSVITAETAGGVIETQSNIEPISVEDPVILQSVTPAADISISPEVAFSTSGVAAELVPVVATVTAAPVAHTIEIVHQDPHIIETEVVDAPVVEPQQATDLVGPSGRISTRESSSVVSGPASTTISEPAKVLIATPVVAAVPVIASVQTPLRSLPVVEVVPDIPTPIASFVLQPTVSSISIPSDITGSTLLPPIASSETIHPPPKVLSSTLASSHWNLVPTAAPELSSSTAVNGIVETQKYSLPPGVQPAATIESASSFGVIENAGGTVQVSSTIRPELSIASTLVPTVSQGNQGNFQNSLNYAFINSRQLSINPSLIPSANIIPPEIGLRPKDTIDLGTVTVSSTPNPLSTIDEANIQRINDNVVVDDNIKHFDRIVTEGVDNQGIGVYEPSQNVPFNHRSLGIAPDGLIGSRLAKYGIDPLQINLAQVPLASTRRLSSPSSLDKDIDDVSSVLWNRYGRDVESKEDDNGSKEKI